MKVSNLELATLLEENRLSEEQKLGVPTHQHNALKEIKKLISDIRECNPEMRISGNKILIQTQLGEYDLLQIIEATMR